MEQGDFDLLKDIPGFKAILRAVLKSQMKHLVEQLSKHGGEEVMVLTTSIVDGSFHQLGSAGAEGFLENRDEIKSQFLGYCLKNVHQQQTEQSHEVEKTVERTKDKTGLNISPGSSKSKKLVSAARKQSESTVLPVSLARVEERTLSETDTYQTGPNAGPSDLNKRKGRGRRKRASETIISEKQVKRAALAETVTYPAQTVQASVESSQGITVVTSDSVKVKEDVDAEGAKAIHPKDAFNILPLHAEAEGAKVMHPKDAFNILPRHTQSESSENKDDTDTRESNGSELEEPDQSMDNIESEGALTGIKVEPADQEEIADVEDSTSQLQLDYSATAAEGEEGAQDSSVQQSGNFKKGKRSFEKKPTLKCVICSYTSKSKLYFDRHLAKHKDKLSESDRFPHVCDQCGLKFKSKYGFRTHVDSKHKQKFRFTCHICGKRYNGLWNFRSHLTSHGDKKQEICDVCDRKFTYRSCLMAHKRKCHSGIITLFECDLCNKTFSCRKGLTEHIMGVHEVRGYKCIDCFKVFRWRSSLSYHRRKCCTKGETKTEDEGKSDEAEAQFEIW